MPAGLVLLTLAFRQEGMFVAATDLPTRIVFASDRLEFVSESLRKMPNQKAKSCSTTRISSCKACSTTRISENPVLELQGLLHHRAFQKTPAL